MANLSAPRLFLLLSVLLALTSAIPAYGQNPVPVICHLQIAGIDYALNTLPNQTLVVTTHLLLTCTSTVDNVIARVDLLPSDSNNIIASNTYFIGPVQLTMPPYSKVFDVAISNSVRAPSTTGVWKLQVVAWVFADVYPQDSAKQPIQVQVGEQSQTLSSNSTAVSSGMIQSQTGTSTFLSPTNATNTGVIALIIVAVGLIASATVFMRRRKIHPTPAPPVPVKAPQVTPQVKAPAPVAVTKLRPVAPPPGNLATGYPELDFLLGGGVPGGYAIIVVSPPCDESDLIFGKIISSALSADYSVFFLSSHLGKSQYLVNRYTKGFYVFSSQADKINPNQPNALKIAGVENLNDLNTSFSKAVSTIPKLDPYKILIIDLLSDVLLEHKALATRKWLDDFLATRKAEGFTVLAGLNPLVSSSQENQTVIDLFDGVIEIYEKKLPDASRRFLIIKKMYGRKYIDTELMLDKKKLF